MTGANNTNAALLSARQLHDKTAFLDARWLEDGERGTAECFGPVLKFRSGTVGGKCDVVQELIECRGGYYAEGYRVRFGHDNGQRKAEEGGGGRGGEGIGGAGEE